MSHLTSGSRSASSLAATSASKKSAFGTKSRRHSTKLVLPVEIPPVIPMAGINQSLKRVRRLAPKSRSVGRVVLFANDARDLDECDQQKRKTHYRCPEKQSPDHADSGCITHERAVRAKAKKHADKFR